MPQKQYFFTPGELARREKELEHLQAVRRPEVAEKIRRSKEMGGTDHNAEYEDAKNEQAFVEGRILELENILKNAVIIKPGKADVVKLGSRVTVVNQDGKPESYVIVGSTEADPGEGKISHLSPVGRALLGRKRGEKVEVPAPAGTIRLRITAIG
jgi:transcription elongation factor GreA